MTHAEPSASILDSGTPIGRHLTDLVDSGPMGAIKAQCRHCLDVSVGSSVEIEKCWHAAGNSRVCKLHAFLRAGKAGKRGWTGAMKAIRLECKLCQGIDKNDFWNMVDRCKSEDCPLWPYRTGHRPM